MENSNLEIGKVYDVINSRKGRFKMQITRQDDTWASGIIVEGVADAIMAYNVAYEGEEVTVRKSMSTFLDA
jgi:hypothetical protein